MRQVLIVGNWKMHKGQTEAAALAREVRQGLEGIDRLKVILAPPFTALAKVAEVIAGSLLELGAQNLFWEAEGAYTGEVSPTMLCDVGCRYVMIGHSERRQWLGESDSVVRRKVKAALHHHLIPIVCVGESLAQRQAGQSCAVVEHQVESSLDGLSPEQVQDVVIAYEPIWAIGTGHTASPAQANEVHHRIRLVTADRFGKKPAERLPILYGGSVKPDHIAPLMAEQEVDGALVGGASLQAEAFCRIVRLAWEHLKE